MQIHVVQPGDTVYKLSELYSTPASVIIAANQLEEPNDLVLGQAIVIPIMGSYYFVQPGDTLFTIANKFNIPSQELARINGLLSNQSLTVGIRLYIPPQPDVPKEVNAYIEPFGTEVSERLIQTAKEVSPFLTYLAPFSYRVQRDGSLIPPQLDDFATIARNNRATLMMVVTNLEEGAFSSELGEVILTDLNVQDTLLKNIVETALSIGFQDVHFDFEFLLPENKADYNAFLVKAKEILSAAGLLMSTALAPKTSAEQKGAWYEAHDYAFHGEVADFVVLMTYEWGYSGGPALPVSPIDEVLKVVTYALSEMPSEKIMLGQNLYGYDWTLPFVQGTYAKAISPQQAIALARQYNVSILYDEEAQAPYFDYIDEEGKRHKVWFEDARSIQSKINMIIDYDLRGISYWKLGLSFPQNWLLIEAYFDVVKRG